jgi:hypothetical protein
MEGRSSLSHNRMCDFGIIGAMGDSITAAFGAKSKRFVFVVLRCLLFLLFYDVCYDCYALRGWSFIRKRKRKEMEYGREKRWKIEGRWKREQRWKRDGRDGRWERDMQERWKRTKVKSILITFWFLL